MKRAFSGVLLVMLLTNMLCSAFKIMPAEASGTIYIRADGSVDPPDAPIRNTGNVTYTFADDISVNADGIVVERDNIIVDGDGYVLHGLGTGRQPEYTGIYLFGRVNVTIRNAQIKTFHRGIRLLSSSNNSIIGNNITGAVYEGIRLFSSSDNSIVGNNLASNYYGIWLFSSSNHNSVSENKMIANTYDGIRFFSSSNNSIARNNITANICNGLMLYYSSNNNSIRQNNIANNGLGLRVSGSSGNVIYHNNLIENDQQVLIEEAAVNVWDGGYPSGGNYWSDYTGLDANGDGIGDMPYIVDPSNQDLYPLIHPWSSLPVHNINTGLGYATIQEAINSNETLGGHTIFVEAGTYYENIVVGKSLVILGENATSTILDSHNPGSFNVIINANVTLSRFTLQNGYSGIFGNHSSIINIKNNIIRNQYYYGVFVQTWGKCNVTAQDNHIVTSSGGIQVSYSEGFCVLEGNYLSQVGSGIMIGYGMMNGKVVNNTIAGNGSGTGMDLSDFCNGTIEGNCITGFNDGARFADTSGNRVTKNVLAANTGFGLALISSDNNTVFGNDILDNGFGVWLSSSSRNNVVCQNNFMNNSQQAHIEAPSYPNTWDSGYPSGGNFWSDYTGVDVKKGIGQNETGSDGIGDTSYIINANNTDRYPLMGMLYSFNVSWVDSGYVVELVSYSTVSAFDVGVWIEHPEDPNTRMIKFNVTGETGTSGFCRICIPTALLNAPYEVLLNGTEIPCTLLPCSNSTHSYLYFNYTHSTQEVTIVPEYPSFLILPLCMIASLLIAVFFKRRKRVLSKLAVTAG